MNIETQTHGVIAVLRPRGPLVGDDAKSFREKARVAIEQRGGRVVLDLSDAPYVDSVGIEALLDVASSSASLGPTVAELCDTVREALDLTDVLPRLRVFDRVESAIRSYKK